MRLVTPIFNLLICLCLSTVNAAEPGSYVIGVEQINSFRSDTICAGDSLLIFGNFESTAGLYTRSNGDPVNPDIDSVELFVRTSPEAEIDIFRVCGLDTVIATVNVTAGISPFSFAWSDESLLGSELGLEPGDYTLTVSGGNGCTEELSVTVDPIPDPVEIELVEQHPLCPGGNTGAIVLLPFNTQTRVGIDGGLPVLTDIVPSLSADIYEIILFDTLGCRQRRLVEIVNPLGPLIVLPNDTTIHLGERKPVFPEILGANANQLSYRWYPSRGLTCDTCAIAFAQPLETTTYIVEITHPNGCMDQDTFRLEIDERERVYIPTAFSPNRNGVNENYTVYGGPEVEEVEFMRIHDRWGGVIFESLNFEPNSTADGWNGTIDGQRVKEGTYFCHVRVRINDGKIFNYAETVLLIR